MINLAQHKKPHKVFTNVRIQKDKPTVYITFERTGVRAPLRAYESNEGIWMRLHNNTRWDINFAAFGVPRENGDIGMFYEVEAVPQQIKSSEESKLPPLISPPSAPKMSVTENLKHEVSKSLDTQEKQIPTGYRIRHSYSPFILASGKSIVFSIPSEHLTDGLALRVGFYYEWQDQDDVLTGREPQSYAYFYSSTIQQKGPQ